MHLYRRLAIVKTVFVYKKKVIQNKKLKFKKLWIYDFLNVTTFITVDTTKTINFYFT